MTTPSPVAIGVLDDTPGGMLPKLLERAFQLAFSELEAAGRMDRSFELLIERAEGLPWGRAHAVTRGHAALASRGALAIVGPAIGDNALVATPCAEANQIPTLNWAGTEEARSEFMFHVQVGSHEEEPLLLARHLVGRGVTRCALVFERSSIGTRYAAFFDAACTSEGLAQVVRLGVGAGARDLAPAAEAALRAAPDAIVYLGLGSGLGALRAELARRSAAQPLFCNSCGMFGWVSPERARELEGVTYVDVVSETNPVLLDALRALGIAFDSGPMSAVYLDLARLTAEGVARAPLLTPAGVREGLLRIKGLPAALGRAGTRMGFGHFERSAYKGEYLVLRRWQAGRSTEVG